MTDDGEPDQNHVSVLPPELRHLDGHPLAALAGRVWEDLTRAGIPVYLGTDTSEQAPNGVTLSLGDTWVMLGWNIPNEQSYTEPTATRAAVFGAAAVLTSAVSGTLTTFGYQVRAEPQELPTPRSSTSTSTHPTHR